MLTKVLLTPWQYYWRTAAFTFTAVTTSNLGTSICDSDRRSLLLQYPSLVTALIVSKGLMIAPIWPSWYLTMVDRPKSAFYLGGGVMAECFGSNTMNEVIEKIGRSCRESFNPTITYADGTTTTLRDLGLLKKQRPKPTTTQQSSSL